MVCRILLYLQVERYQQLTLNYDRENQHSASQAYQGTEGDNVRLFDWKNRTSKNTPAHGCYQAENVHNGGARHAILWHYRTH